jgi:hypothetical protein
VQFELTEAADINDGALDLLIQVEFLAELNRFGGLEVHLFGFIAV